MGEGHGLNVLRRSGGDREGMMVGLAMVGGAFVCVYIVGWRAWLSAVAVGMFPVWKGGSIIWDI